MSEYCEREGDLFSCPTNANVERSNASPIETVKNTRVRKGLGKNVPEFYVWHCGRGSPVPCQGARWVQSNYYYYYNHVGNRNCTMIIIIIIMSSPNPVLGIILNIHHHLILVTVSQRHDDNHVSGPDGGVGCASL